MNLLKETIEVLNENGHTPKDVLWVGCDDFKTSWDNFARVADVDYCDCHGDVEVAVDIMVNGTSFWLEREDDEGEEQWKYRSKKCFEPELTMEIKAVTIEQAKELGFNCKRRWATLSEINGIKPKH